MIKTPKKTSSLFTVFFSCFDFLQDFFFYFFHNTRASIILFLETLRVLPSWKKESSSIMEQVYLLGFKSLPLVIVTAFATGMVMTLQFGLGLSRFGGTLYVPRLVTVSILREMGPVFTSLMLAARIASGLAAEIGSMVVTQQIDAIATLGSSPMRKIVLPRILACFIAVPLVCVLSNFVALSGVFLISSTELQMDPLYALSKMNEGFSLDHFASGFFKTFFFGLFIGVPACHYGLNVQRGTREVGLATTKSVVTASVLILVGDFILTKLFMVLF
jgi:phospholipid/cholesterol/gamma-HCH transport system permease protein